MNEGNILMNTEPRSIYAEAFRTLRTNIQFSSIDRRIKTITITSCCPGEGKSTVASNLAAAVAQAGKHVMLIDCDLRKPTIHDFFNLSNRRGITNILVEDLDYFNILKPGGITGLDVLTSGPVPPNPSELLGSVKMKMFLEKIRKDYDMIILDTSPAGLVTDASVLSTITDGTILVCAVKQSTIDQVKACRNMLEKVDANILGIVVNKFSYKQDRYHNYNYYYESKKSRKGEKNKNNDNKKQQTKE